MSGEIMDEAEVPDLPNMDNFKMPSVDELLAALERMDGLTEENKKELRESVLARAEGGHPNFIPPGAAPPGPQYDILILLSLITIILLILVFFGYKLYRSLSEREKRKEEKRRQKQQKKKK